MDIYSVVVSFLEILGVLLSKTVKHVDAIKSGVISDVPRNGLETFSESIDDNLVLAGDVSSISPEVLANLHLNSSSSRDNLLGLHSSPHNHNSVI